MRSQRLAKRIEAEYGHFEGFAKAISTLFHTQKTDTQKPIQFQEMVELLSGFFENKPVEKVWIFGSFARLEHDDESDIDLLIEFKKPLEIDLFDYAEIKLQLEKLVGRSVDLVEMGQELDAIREGIEIDKKLIYEKRKT